VDRIKIVTSRGAKSIQTTTLCYLGNCTSAGPIAISKVENSEHLRHVLLLTWNSVNEFNLIIFDLETVAGE
tara:strand:+ start:701 stop:913 length:213 start_codon:yes stop_codon:yes gene_type:complete